MFIKIVSPIVAMLIVIFVLINFSDLLSEVRDIKDKPLKSLVKIALRLTGVFFYLSFYYIHFITTDNYILKY